jgi:hypothetical protein
MDTGIDLYCETVDPPSNEPFLHFWVQVKSGNQVEVREEGARCARISGKKVLYWLRQPVPVYLFLLPKGDTREFYVTSLTWESHNHPELRHTAEQQNELTIDARARLGDSPNDLPSFFNLVLRDYVLQGAQRGTCRAVPQVKETYIRRSIPGLLGQYVDEVLDTVRRTVSMTLYDLTLSKNPSSDATRQMAFLADVLAHFTQARSTEEAARMHPNGKWHYEDYLRVGLYHQAQGRLAEGDALIKASVTCIDEDPEFKARVSDVVLLKQYILSHLLLTD